MSKFFENINSIFFIPLYKNYFPICKSGTKDILIKKNQKELMHFVTEEYIQILRKTNYIEHIKQDVPPLILEKKKTLLRIKENLGTGELSLQDLNFLLSLYKERQTLYLSTILQVIIVVFLLTTFYFVF